MINIFLQARVDVAINGELIGTKSDSVIVNQMQNIYSAIKIVCYALRKCLIKVDKS